MSRRPGGRDLTRNMIKALKVNLNRCHVAHDLLEQTLTSDGYDLALISEPNRGRVRGPAREADENEDAAAWLPRKRRVDVKRRGRGKGFVCVDINVAVVYSCYVSPNTTFEEYEAFLGELEESVGSWTRAKLLVVTGDFNAAAEEWGSARGDARGEALLEMANRRELCLAYDGREPTFRRAGHESFLDLTLYATNARGSVDDWSVLGTETLSDPRYVAFMINSEDRDEARREEPRSK